MGGITIMAWDTIITDKIRMISLILMMYGTMINIIMDNRDINVNPMFHNNNHNIIINNNHNIKNLQVDQTASLIPTRVNCTTRGEQNGMLPITINTDRVLPELRVQLKL